MRTLDNGLRITVLANPEPPDQATFELIVRAGSRHDPTPGTAHFVEHMAFNGTRTFPGTELQSWLLAHGGPPGRDQNAHTSPDHTWFHLSGSTLDPQWQATVPRILRDWADGITFDPAEVASERGVLEAELDIHGLDELSRRLGAPSARELRNALRTLTSDDLRAFHETWYRADRMELVAVGDLDVEATAVALEQAFGDLAAGSPPDPTAAPPPRLQFLGAGGTEQLVSLSLPIPDTVPGAPVEVLARVLARRLAVLPHSRVEVEGSTLTIGAVDLRAPRAEPLALRLLGPLAAGAPPTRREVEDARDAVLLGWLERPFAHAPEESVAWREALHRARVEGASLSADPFAEVAALRAGIEGVTVDEVAAAGSAVLRWPAASIVAVGPEVDESTLSEAFGAAPAIRDPPPPPPPMRGPSGSLRALLVESGVAVWALDSGAEVLYRQLDLPVVVVAVTVPRAGADEPDARSWPARLAAADPGTAWTASVGDDQVRIAGRLLPDRTDEGLQHLASLLADPDTPVIRSELRAVITGPMPVAELAALVGVSLAGVPAPPMTPRRPAPPRRAGEVRAAGPGVVGTWQAPLLAPRDIEELPVLVEELELALRRTVRESLGATYEPRVMLTLPAGGAAITMVVPCAPADVERVTEAVASVLTALRAGAEPDVARRWVPSDPRDPDPTRWAATMLDRLRVYDTLVTAWQAPRIDAPDGPRLRDLARHYLPEEP